MKKSIIRMLIITYVVIMVILPIAFYLFEYEEKPVKFSIGLDFKNNSIVIFGDSFVVNEVYLNNKRMVIIKDKGLYSTDEVMFIQDTTQNIKIIDAESKIIDFNLAFLPNNNPQKEYIKIFSRFDVNLPQIAINNNRQYMLDEKTLDTKYELLGETNAYIDVNYSKTPFNKKFVAFASVSYAMSKDLSISLSRGLYLFMKFSGKVMVETIKIIYKISKVVYRLLKYIGKIAFETLKIIIKGIGTVSKFIFKISLKIGKFFLNALINIAHKINSVFPKFMSKTATTANITGKIFLKGFDTIWHGVMFVFNAVKWVFQSLLKIVHFVIQTAENVIKWVSNKIIKFLTLVKTNSGKIKFYFIKGRKINVIASNVIVSSDLSKNSFIVGTTAKELKLQLKDGFGQVIASENIRLELEKSTKSNSRLLDNKNKVTDSNGEISFSIQFGQYVYPHRLIVYVRKKKIPLKIYLVASDPYYLKNMRKEVVIVGSIGKSIKNAFSMEVTDKYGNQAGNAEIEFYEKESDDDILIKYAEKITNDKGRLIMDYQMEDEARKFFIVAKLKNNPSETIMYSIRIKAKSAETIDVVGLSERQAIVDIPIKDPFSVKIIDKFENPVSDMKINFTLVNEVYEDVAQKSARTNKNGIASVKFDTPKEVGEYQVIAGVEKNNEMETAISLLVLPGSATKITIISGNNQSVDWDQDLPIPLKFQVFDDLGNPIPDVAVYWTKPKQAEWIEKEDRTDIDGFSQATLKMGKTNSKEVYAFARIGQAKAVFKIKPREPSIYKLYLLSEPIVKVFADQRLPNPITFKLRDQYENILKNTEVMFEYIVTRRGIQYLQNIKHLTNEEGLVSINFLVSDQKDIINFKGKYTPDKNPIITWVTIEVLPEDISLVNLDRNIVTATVYQKLNKPIEVFVGDNNDRPVSEIYLDIIPTSAPLGEIAKIEKTRIQTDRKGIASFSPPIGKTAGEYVYSVTIKTLSKTLIVNAVADKPAQIKITSRGTNLYPVGEEIKEFHFIANDEYNNSIKDGYFFYDVRKRDKYFFGMNKKMKILKHRFNKKVFLDNKGVGNITFKVPEEEGEYYLYITDADYKVRVYYPFKAKGIRTNSINLLKPNVKIMDYYVAEKISNLFSFEAIDKFGNPSKKVNISLDLFQEGVTKSSQGIDTQTNLKGQGSFSITMPEKRGVYTAIIYPTGINNVEKRVTINILPKGIEKASIIAGDNQLVNVGSKFTQDFILKVEDFYGNPVNDSEIRWSYIQKVKGDSKTVTITKITNSDGTCSFNFVNDGESGVRELKAQYKKNNKWEYLSFYVKVVSNIADSIEKISGDNQKAYAGREVKDSFVIKVLDVNGYAVSDLPVVYDIGYLENNKIKKLSPIEIYTNEVGIASAKIIAPLNEGIYEVTVYPKQNNSKKVKFSLTVQSDVYSVVDEQKRLNDNTGEKSYKYKLLPVNDVNVTLELNEKKDICYVMLIDQNNNSVSGKTINWELYDSKAEQTFNRISKTDEKGFTQISKLDTSTPRILIIKAIEKESGAFIVFNVEVLMSKKEIVSDTSTEKNDNNDNNEKLLALKKEPEDSRKNSKLEEVKSSTDLKFNNECIITVKEGKVQASKLKDINMYSKGIPLKLIIHNQEAKPNKYIVEIKERKRQTTIELGIDEKQEIIILPAQMKFKETLKVYQSGSWFFAKKLIVDFNLLTSDSDIYNLINLDDLNKTVTKKLPLDFRFELKSKEELAHKFFNIIVSVKDLNKNEQLITGSMYTLVENTPIIYQYMFKDNGLFLVEILSELSDKKLNYYVNVLNIDATANAHILREKRKQADKIKTAIYLEEEKRDIIKNQNEQKQTKVDLKKPNKEEIKTPIKKEEIKTKIKEPTKEKIKEEIIIKKQTGDGPIEMEPIITVVPISILVSKANVVKSQEKILWEIYSKPVGADIQFEKENSTDKEGIAMNMFVVKSISGKYVMRAKLKSKPEVFVDFIMDLY